MPTEPLPAATFSGDQFLVIGLVVAAVLWFAVFEVLRRQAAPDEKRSGTLALTGAAGTFVFMTAALALALKFWK